MQAARNVIQIDRPPDDVYAFVSDFNRHAEFAGHRLRIEHVEGPIGAAGGRFRSHGHQLGQDVVDELTIVEAERPHRFVFESRGRDGAFRHGYLIEPSGNGSRLTRTMELVDPSLPVRLVMPLVNLFVAMRNARDLKRLKQLIER